MMNADKQIEEMAKVVDTVMQRRCFHKSCNECEFDPHDICKATMLADALINDYCYRKAEDVARKIFEEIENNSYKYGVNFLISEETLAELKKKYTEGQK